MGNPYLSFFLGAVLERPFRDVLGWWVTRSPATRPFVNPPGFHPTWSAPMARSATMFFNMAHGTRSFWGPPHSICWHSHVAPTGRYAAEHASTDPLCVVRTPLFWDWFGALSATGEMSPAVNIVPQSSFPFCIARSVPHRAGEKKEATKTTREAPTRGSNDPRGTPVLPAKEWVIAMRARLGAPIFNTDSVCGCCDGHRMDATGYHALCCAMAESTVGHNRIRDCLAECFAGADPGTVIEVPGLCPRAPSLRPADILSRAPHPTTMVAIDVGVRAPHASTAGNEPLENMRSDKLNKYEDHRQDLSVQGISVEPAIFSAYGRRHFRATHMIKHAVAKAARRGGSAAGGLTLE